MAGVTSAGAGSGIDFESIIKASVDAYKSSKETHLKDQQEKNDTRISGLGTLNSVLDKFESAVKELNDLSDFQRRSSSISQDAENEFLSASVENDALVGTYAIEVQKTARGSRAMSADSSYTSQSDVVSNTAGTLTFGAGDKSFTVDVTAGMTLGQLSEAINNADDNIGIGATIINTGSGARLVYNSTITGDGNDLTVTGTSSDLDALTTTAADGSAGGMNIADTDKASSAEITIDGVTLTSDSNTFKDAITDVDLTIADGTEVGSKATIKIDRDEEGLKKSMGNLVEAYNNLMNEIDNLTKAGGDLDNDSSIKGLKTQVFDALSTHVDSNGTLNTIWAAGFDVDNSGELSVDDDELDEIIDNYYDQIGSLLAGDDGVLNNVLDTLKPFTQSSGLVDNWTEQLEQDQKDIGNQISDIEVSRSGYEQQLRQKYGNLDAQLAQLYSQQSYVMSLLGSL